MFIYYVHIQNYSKFIFKYLNSKLFIPTIQYVTLLVSKKTNYPLLFWINKIIPRDIQLLMGRERDSLEINES